MSLCYEPYFYAEENIPQGSTVQKEKSKQSYEKKKAVTEKQKY